jgi:putative FmdB family regulatory protein
MLFSMPIYEYICRACSHQFETLVTGERQPSCPSCQGRQLEKQLSVFAVSAKSQSSTPVAAPAACGTCGDPRGSGACRLN